MDKKTSIVLLVIGVVIIFLIALAFGLEGNAKQLTSDDVLRINNEIYTRSEFEEFIKYTLYQNGGEISIDEEEYAESLANGTSKEDLFLSDTLNSFYQMKVYSILAADKNITLSEDEIAQIDSDFDSNSGDILAVGLTKESFANIEKQQNIMQKIAHSPSDYLKLPDELYDGYVSNFSGDDVKSYTYRIIQVGYTADTVSGEVSGESSGEFIPGDRAEKEAYMNTLVARINSGESFETVGESGDNRFIVKGNGIEFAKCPEEYAAGLLLKQKMGEDLYEVAVKTEPGNVTSVVDTGNEFQIALIVKVDDDITGEAKDELVELLISEYAGDLIYSYVKDTEVNNSAVSRIKIK